MAARKYQPLDESPISEFIEFAPVEMGDRSFVLEFHRIPGLDQTQIVIRNTKAAPNPPGKGD
jgi:hypothetical protein